MAGNGWLNVIEGQCAYMLSIIIVYTGGGCTIRDEAGYIWAWRRRRRINRQKRSKIGNGLLYSPAMMLSLMICTWRSRSGRVCSCQNPTTWPNSWTTIPNLSQFLPILMACGPLPRFPTKEQHLNQFYFLTLFLFVMISCYGISEVPHVY